MMSAVPPVHRRRFRTVTGLLIGGALAGLALVAVPAPVTAAASIGNIVAAVADDGAKVLSETVVDSRTVDLLIQSPALGGPTTARLLLPKDWATSPTLAWPTLYLLHGANDVQDYKSWTAYTDVKAFTASKNVLIALPSDGPAGIYTDTWNPFGLPNSSFPKWETYHTEELPQILQRGYRSNNVKALAGISTGGYGALIYSAHHPGQYRAAASYSGLTNILDFRSLVAVTGQRLQAGQFLGPWGSAVLNNANWVAHNPYDQAKKLAGTQLFLSAGDGKPGPLDDPNFKETPVSRVIEDLTGGENQQFVARLKQLGVPVTADLYTGGYHNWVYWQREFHTSWPMLEAALGAPTTGSVAAAPAPKSTNRWDDFFGG
jgi:S-formylglutathione hydrolase FrmB